MGMRRVLPSCSSGIAFPDTFTWNGRGEGSSFRCTPEKVARPEKSHAHILMSQARYAAFPLMFLHLLHYSLDMRRTGTVTSQNEADEIEQKRECTKDARRFRYEVSFRLFPLAIKCVPSYPVLYFVPWRTILKTTLMWATQRSECAFRQRTQLLRPQVLTE